MRSVDTNVLARYVMRDDEAQARVADATLSEPCFISDTVFLETAWLLSSRYRLTRAVLAATLADLLQLPAVTVSDPDRIGWAIERFAAGADFADMMHIVASDGADSFVTFERDMVHLAGSESPIPVETLG